MARGSSPPILMIHGDFGDGFETWGVACAQIGRRYRTIAVDRPGLGIALPPDTRFTVSSEAADLLRVPAEMGLDSFHLAGHSYGGLIALEMAAQQPGRIRSLHLIEPPLLALLPEREDVREMARQVRIIQAEHARTGDEATTEAFFAMIGAGHVPERLRGTDDWQRLCQHASRFARNEAAGDVSSAVLERLPAEIPVGLYSGGRSHPALRAIAQELARRLPGARFTDVPAAGHAVQMAGEAFVEPLLGLAAEADAVWPRRRSAIADAAREERALR
ncbi:MAG: alpha/beta hydrolase fold protein [Thermomicrobiales bacterium]|nr:alpha/beta hydrolase fold protein [Thermomicrobiales bacterium]